MLRLNALFVATTLSLAAIGTDQSEAKSIIVPAENFHKEQPNIPGASKRRTAALKTTFEKKYQKVLKLLQRDKKLITKIKSASKKFGIDPIHMAGAIIGEHTYNVDAYDRLQTYYVKAISYLKSDFDFSYKGESLSEFLEREPFKKCDEQKKSDAYWLCAERVWKKSYRGKKVDGQKFPKDRFGRVFFQPFYAGQTFGIGQLNPLTALQASDVVAKKTGKKPISHKKAKGVYEAILDPDLTLLYMAATIKKSIDSYRSIAGFDISKNPGITATLYNVGDPRSRAYALKAINAKRKKAGKKAKLPEENYYGWLVNDKIDDLKALF